MKFHHPFNHLRDFPEAFAAKLWHAARRGGPGHGGFAHGHPFGHRGGGFDEDGVPGRGRKFRSEDLQLLLLALIAEAPRHGYELIKALEQRSNGAYVPSPGMVYPTLTLLEDLGYVTVAADGTRKSYSLSEQGRTYLQANRERADLVMARLNLIAKKMEMMRRAMAGESWDEQSQGAPWVAEFIEARRALKSALHARHNAPPEEQRRIADILKRAAAEIESTG